ncbi:MAG: DUF389 domain-containing protein [Acidimicrobiia bacterium]|jgi:uncharacterized hydrophobic protein (TIGR00271 family)
MAIRRIALSPAVHRAAIAIVAALTALAYPRFFGQLLFLVVGAVAAAAGVAELISWFRGRVVKELLQSLGLLAVAVVLLFGGERSDRVLALVLVGLLVWRALVVLVGEYRSWRAGVSDPFWPVARAVALLLLALALALIPDTLLRMVILLMAVSWIVGGAIVIVNVIGEDEDSPVPDDVVSVIREKSMSVDIRAQVTDAIFDGFDARSGGVAFAALMAFATAIATFGVKADSTAVVIGAMLIAPLMSPIMALSASILMGWSHRAVAAARRVTVGVVIGVGGAYLMALISPEFTAITANSEVLSRTAPTILDLLIALAAGAAGGYAMTHPNVGNSLPGVAIAVALAPPLAVVGYSLEEAEWTFATGAFLLFLTNLVGIVVAAGVTYVVSGYSPWTRIERGGDQARRSLVLIAISLGLVALPLGIIGEGIVHETNSHSIANEETKAWLGEDSGYSLNEVDVTGSEVTVTLEGSGDLPEATDLASQLAAALETEVVLVLDVIPRETTVVEADRTGAVISDGSKP